MPLSTHSEYTTRKQRVIDQAKALHQQGLSFSLGKKTSNLFRNRRPNPNRIDVTDFDHVLQIDTEKMQVTVEGMTPFDSLVKETLKHLCLPAVVPELKSITVGGGLTGVAIESSSFRYGLVHETIIEAEILLADGTTVTCTRDNEHKDLFFGFPNTYGSLGYALKVTMKLIPAKPYVKITRQHFTDPDLYFQKMAEVCAKNRSGGPIAYVDGVAFRENDLYLILGEFVDHAPYTSNYQYLKAYYRSIPKRAEDYLTAYDYIWRWDTDWFWCSNNFGMQYWPLRMLLGKWMLKSTAYWKIMHFARNSRLFSALERAFAKPKETVIQDIEVPVCNAPEFHQFFHRQIGIKPVWLCPVQTCDASVRYPFYDLDPTQLFINFGFWDTVPSTQPPGHYNRLIETQVRKLNGHKSLYSDVYYTETEFWQLYDRQHYENLKSKYDPKGGLKQWFSKVTG